MSTESRRAQQISALKKQIQEILHEDPANLDWVLQKVDRLSWSAGEGVHSSLMLLLANVALEEEPARREWEAILRHRQDLERALRRRVPLRVALLDRLVEANRTLARPRLLEVLQTDRPLEGELTDRVTGLHTRSFLEDQIPRELARARRYHLHLSLIHLEIDDFSRIVEEMGQTVGPILLKETAAIITSCIRSIDYSARLSAAQFALLLTETDRMGAYYVADRIRQKVEEFYLERRVDGRPFELTVSAGVAAFPQDAGDDVELQRRACEAFFTARTRGRHRVAIHCPERREFLRLTLDNEDLQVTLLPEDAATKSPATMRNISSGGILFESDTPIELGRSVQILCRSKPHADQVQIPGRVARIERFEEEGGDRYEIGILFDLVVEEQVEGIIELLERLSAEAGPGDRRGSPSE